MDLDLLQKYHQFITRDNPHDSSVEEVIKSYFWHETFHITQELIDANPRFLELPAMLPSQTKLDIYSVFGEDLALYLPPTSLKNVKEILFLRSNINGFFKYAKYMESLEKLIIGQFQEDEEIPKNQFIDNDFLLLNQLSSLDIWSDKIIYIPERLDKLSNLKILRLGLNILPPKYISSLPNLGELSISLIEDNLDRKYIFDIISEIENLGSLGYSDPYTSELPIFGENLQSLTNFHLDMIKITEVPTIIKDMKNLTHLSLFLNIRTLPDWILNLKNLEYLRIEGLSSGKLPTFLKELPKLTTINLIGCMDIRLHEERVNQVKEDFPDIKVIGVNADY